MQYWNCVRDVAQDFSAVKHRIDALHSQGLARHVTRIAGSGLRNEALRRALLELVVERYDELETFA